jgi:putative hemolysin
MEGNIGWKLLALLVLTAINGFFAASEVALLSVRRSRLEALAEDGHLGAQAALSLLSNTERLLSTVQVGINLCALAMGSVGESAIFGWLSANLTSLGLPVPALAIHIFSLSVSYGVLTLLLAVIGEVLPKNFAIDRAERWSTFAAPVLLVFFRLSGPLVRLVESSSRVVSRFVGLKAQEGAGASHTVEELKYIAAASAAAGHLLPSEMQALDKLLELRELVVREVMVPRGQMVSLPVDSELDAVLQSFADSHYSRIPVYRDRPDEIVGILHFRDLLGVWQQRRRSTGDRKRVREFRLEDYMRPAVIVPETKPLLNVIDEFRTSHTHMACVVDEHGQVTGLVTLEDALEQVFGEIEDEHDIARQQAPVSDSGEIEVEGTIPIRDLETHYGIELPPQDGFETLAGFLLYRLGHIPEEGESVEEDGRRYTVLQLETHRIARVLIERLPMVAS